MAFSKRDDMANTTVVKDPVCGMDVDVNSAATKSDYKGQTYYFCCLGCKAKFDAAPESTLRESGDKAKSGGCGSGCGCG